VGKLTLELARSLIQVARETAGGKPVVVAVVDSGGDLIAFERMDKTGKTMARVALGKAYTAAVSGRETAAMADKAKENPLFWHSVAAKDPGPFIFGRGGAPLIEEGEVVGAVGVSGPSGDIDVACAKAAAEEFARWSARQGS
jgi:uncharacterized protein GlcG (DUF336 family)